MLGVLGGMGPLATADFMRKVILHTEARRDQEHLPMIVHSVPQIPDRSDAIIGDGPSPLEALRLGLARLEKVDCRFVAIPCNTAHHWYEALQASTPLPILHIADAVCEALERRGLGAGARITLLATEGTLASGYYEKRLAARGYRYEPLPKVDRLELVMKGIEHVKAGRLEAAAPLFERCLRNAQAAGVGAAILGCTEIALALESPASPMLPFTVDSNTALADACIAWWNLNRAAMPG